MSPGMVHPAWLFFAVAGLVACTRGLVRQTVLLLGTGLSVWVALHLTPGDHWVLALPYATLRLLHVDALSRVFVLLFSLTAWLGVLYSLHVSQGGEPVAALVYAGAAIGVVLAGDWLTFFAYWELMAVASLFIIWHGRTALAYAAGFRYVLLHVLGGALLLAGILWHVAQTETFTLQALTTVTTRSPGAFWLILLGIGLNAAMPPLHAWLPDAYPEATVTGSVFLSAFTTKTAVYALIRCFPGAEVLVWAGVLMALYGVIYAILEDNTRRLLSYHIISQVGYMVVGVGLGTELGLNGASAHAVANLLYKTVLFMAVGAVIQATGEQTLHAYGGLWRRLPRVGGLYMIAALAISGVPLLNGFISKSMVVTAAVDASRPVLELLLTLASVGTFLSVGLKLPTLTFLGPTRAVRLQPVPWNMLLAMLLGNVLCVLSGVFPTWLYTYLPFRATGEPYTAEHVLAVVQLLMGTGLGFWWGWRLFGEEDSINLDTDWVYRKPLARAFTALIQMVRYAGACLEAMGSRLLQAIRPYYRNPFVVLAMIQSKISRAQVHDGSTRGQPSEVPYHEDRYRQPLGTTILWILFFFVLLTWYSWMQER